MINVKKGDIILVDSPSFIDNAIAWVERRKSKDKQARFGHSAIIIDSCGRVFESFQTARVADMYHRFNGKYVLIARYKKLDEFRCDTVLQNIMDQHEGDQYPWQRMIFYLLGIEKYIHYNNMVCSELVAKFLHNMCKQDCVFDFEHYFGMTPDNLNDIFCAPDSNFQIIFEGSFKK